MLFPVAFSIAWIFAPAISDKLTLWFEPLNLRPGLDVVTVDGCLDPACSQSVTIEIPAAGGLIQSETSQLRLTFTSQGFLTAPYATLDQGFRAFYAGSRVTDCADGGALAADHEGFLRASPSALAEGKPCSWVVSPREQSLSFGPEAPDRELTFLPLAETERPVVTVSRLAVEQFCAACPPHTTTRSRSASFLQTNCTCNAGFSGPDGGVCVECAAGSYKDGTGSEPCARCPPGSFKQEPGPGSCTACPANTFARAGAVAASNCSACPAHTSAPPGSAEHINCACDAGYEGPDGGPCTACPAGTFKDGGGSGACMTCEPGSYKPTPGPGSCTACPAGTYAAAGAVECWSCPANSTAPPGSADVTDCSCEAGVSGPDGGVCVECAAGSYKDGTGSEPCARCPPGSFKQEPGPGSCTACPAGMYAAAGAVECSSCPPLSSAPPRSADAANCSCNAGFSGPDGGACIPCAAGAYKDAPGSGSCAGCLPGSFSKEASAAHCDACPAGSFSGANASGCAACPPGSTSAPGSEVCACKAGYSGPSSEACEECKAGEYKASVGSLACEACPPNSIGPPGSTGRHLCMCVAGFTGSPDGECVACSGAAGCNHALFGPCVASDVRALEVKGPGLAHAGASVEMRVVKRDLYAQRIVTDSSSVLQAAVASGSAELLGSPISVMFEGEARFALAVKPSWVEVDAGRGTARLVDAPRILFRGLDAQADPARSMASAPVLLNLSTGRLACPPGSVLALDPPAAAAAVPGVRAGACARCGPGSYSLDALAGPGGEPGCFSCPAGAQYCAAGQVSFREGDWREVNGSYTLLGCPLGYGMAGAEEAGGGLAQELQQCVPCGQGSECTQAPCRSCAPCRAGSFKDATGTHSCRPCPAGSFGGSLGATSANDCRPCPANSGTRGRAGQVAAAACECNEGFYAVERGGEGGASASVECVTCPRGAECSAEGHKIRTRDGLDATGEVVWGRGGDGRWELRRCPRGFRLARAHHDEQACVACGPGAFVLASDDPAAQCHRCPEGLRCLGGGPPPRERAVAGRLELAEVEACAGMESAGALEAWLRGVLREAIGGGDAAVVAVALPDHALPTCQAALTATEARRAAAQPSVVAQVEMVGDNATHEELLALVDSPAFVDALVAALAARGEARAAPTLKLAAGEGGGASAGAVGEFEAREGALRLVGCPAGYLLVNYSLEVQHCKRCEALTYSVSPLDGCTRGPGGEAVCGDRQCQSCPSQGAACEGLDHFAPLVPGSEWALQASETGLTWRVVRCPAGYVAVRADVAGGNGTRAAGTQAAQDHCWECPPGTYALRPAAYPEAMTAASVAAAQRLCRACELDKADCGGGARVVARADFWRGADTPDGQATLYRCSLDRCKGGVGPEQCASGWTGPVCGLCVEGWALASGGTSCESCASKQARGVRTAVLALLLLAFLLVWYYAAWRAFLYPRDGAERRALEAEEEEEGGVWCGRLGRRCARLWDRLLLHFLRSHYLAYFKVFISFWQVASTFRVNIRIRWPQELVMFWSWTSALRLSLFDVPGTACMMKDYLYTDVLLACTLATVLVIVLFAIPTVYMRVVGQQDSAKFTQVFNSFCFSATFTMFLTYPTLCMVVISTFRCQEVEGVWYLTSDFRERCPWTQPESLLFNWGVASTIAIPLGVPALMWWVLRRWRVPAMAREKQDRAVLERMVWLHSLSAEKSLTAKIAAYMGVFGTAASRQNAEVLRERAERFYNDATRGGETELTASRLLEHCHNLGLVGENEEEETRVLFATFDEDCDDVWNFNEFLEFMVTLEEHENHAARVDSLAQVTNTLLQDLCLFDWNTVTKEEDEDEGAGLERELKRRLKQRYRLQTNGSSARLTADKYATIVRSRSADSAETSRRNSAELSISHRTPPPRGVSFRFRDGKSPAPPPRRPSSAEGRSVRASSRPAPARLPSDLSTAASRRLVARAGSAGEASSVGSADVSSTPSRRLLALAPPATATPPTTATPPNSDPNNSPPQHRAEHAVPPHAVAPAGDAAEGAEGGAVVSGALRLAAQALAEEAAAVHSGTSRGSPATAVESVPGAVLWEVREKRGESGGEGRERRAETMDKFLQRASTLRALTLREHSEQHSQSAATVSTQGGGELDEFNAKRLIKPCPLGLAATREERLAWLLRVGRKLHAWGYLEYTLAPWNTRDPREVEAIEKFGFFFDSYKVDYWWYELVEMARKFVMTGMMGLLMDSSLDQLSAGLTVTLLLLLHFVHVQPYSNMLVNHMQTAALTVQAVTLLYGIIQFQSDQTGAGQSHAFGVLVILFHIMIFAIPPVAVFYEEGYHLRRYIKRKCCWGCYGLPPNTTEPDTQDGSSSEEVQLEGVQVECDVLLVPYDDASAATSRRISAASQHGQDQHDAVLETLAEDAGAGVSLPLPPSSSSEAAPAALATFRHHTEELGNLASFTGHTHKSTDSASE